MQSMLDRVRELKKRGLVSVPTMSVPVPVQKVVEVKSQVPKMTVQEAMVLFGHTVFKAGQEEAINGVINGSDGSLIVFPTGHGKSLCFQVPALVVDGITLVVSPLISLMKDQVDKLQKLGVKAELVNSSLTSKQMREVMVGVMNGRVKILYVAPERFDNDDFHRMMDGVEIGLFAIDEAHCISKFGNDFRPSYSRLGEAIRGLKPKRVVALTATATKVVQDDICLNLGILKAERFVRGVHRANLEMAVIPGLAGDARVNEMCNLVLGFQRDGNKTGIIYTATRNEAESVNSYLKKRGIDAVYYHAGMVPAERTSVQSRWQEEGGVVVATCAFGMGIDRPDVRFVFCSGLTANIEDWWQLMGRGGRDGELALCASFWDYGKDYYIQKMFIDMSTPDEQSVRAFWMWLRGIAINQAVGGAKTATVNLTQKEMGSGSGCSNVGGCVAFLRNQGVVKTLGRGKYQVSLGDVAFDYSELGKRRQASLDKLNQVVEFYQTKDCRAGFICNYFGDNGFTPPCMCCDNCDHSHK